MTKLKKLSARAYAARAAVTRELNRLFPVGTRVRVEIRPKRFAYAKVSSQAMPLNGFDRLILTNETTGRKFTAHYSCVVALFT